MMSSSFRWLILLGFTFAGLSGCRDTDSAGTGNLRPNPNAVSPAASLTKEDFQKAFVLRNRGIAHLENKAWADAEKALAALAELLPENILATRNLAIARVLSLVDNETPYAQSGPPEKVQAFAAAVDSAKTAIVSFRAVASDDFNKALANLLEGRLLDHADSPASPSFAAALQKLQAAADGLPDAADFRFAVANAMDGDREYTDPNSAKSAEFLRTLETCFELAPQNLFALQRLMQRQALCLRSKNEETKRLALNLTNTLASAIKLLEPLNESFRKNHDRDLVGEIEIALKEFDESKPESLMRPAMSTGYLLISEIACKIDHRRLSKNLLEYLVLEFDDEFLAAANKAGAIPQPEPTVVKAFVATDGLPQLAGVTQVGFQDMNLDGFDDCVVSREGKIEVYSRGTDLHAEWQLMMTSPDAGFGVTEFLLVDFDRDYDKALSDIKTPSILRDADGDQKIPTDPAGINRWYDTDLDVIAWSDEGVVIFRNETSKDARRSLSLVPQSESIQGVNDIAAADLEADGDLDLILATDAGMTLWKNIDGTTFENMNSSASLPEHGLEKLSVVDWNSDIGIDVIGAGVDGKHGCLENIFHGRFRWLPMEGSIGGPNFAIADNLGDARWGISSVNPSRWLTIADLDNDGYSDEIIATDQGVTWRRGTAQAGVAAEPQIQITDLKVAGLAIADYDDDGDLDLVLVNSSDGSLKLLINDGGNSNNWIDVVARAVPNDPQFPSNRVNMHAIGSMIEMRAGGLYHAEVITQPKVHLGLGKATVADAIRIIWTDGIPQNVTMPELLKPHVGILAPQILKGSCPYIYTWTGDRFEFFSDCLWAAPIGLVQASGEIAPTRSWENLLIPGEALVEKDGRYVLQFTEELWETAYFDHVRLTAIDHPADVSIFTNEKVGPPGMAEHRVHTVRDARLPVSVADGRGNNLLPGLAKQDGNYIQAFNGRIMQGLTDEWTMEFNLGELTTPKNIRLFLLGWVFPTDTSLNVGIEQNPDLDPPAGPSIEVPDGNGGWKTARPFVGFPSGKTKAMVIDISNIFTDNNYRFRIKSSMELYWDRAFFTIDEEDAETHSQACELANGHLHFRGFSRRIYADNSLFRQGHAPEGYDYQSVTTDPRWPPISGRFTRFGDATPLLWEHDDQMVVMGPGDELTLTFDVPATPVPEGWKRDFVLMNVGYDKDADLNTIYGQSSEPFPFRAMTRYPFAPGDRVPDSPEYHKYLNDWQTREYSEKPFWNALKQP